jgi:L-lactate dehydrogenase complex protein LldG
MLAEKGIQVADPRDGSVRVGITGVEAALGATGSLVMSALPGKPRSVSLLPHVHIAVLTEAQILPHFEAWIAQVRTSTDSFRQTGNHIIITGASRTGDIGFELVLGAHGPAVLHVIILK